LIPAWRKPARAVTSASCADQRISLEESTMILPHPCTRPSLNSALGAGDVGLAIGFSLPSSVPFGVPQPKIGESIRANQVGSAVKAAAR